MAGIMQQQMAQANAAPAQEQAPNEQGVEQPEDPNNLQPEEPTPEEQEMFTRIEVAAKKIIHDDPKSFKGVTDILQAGKEEPAAALAKAAMVVFQVVDEKTKGGVPEEMLLRAAEVTLDLVIEVADDTGIIEVDEELANNAMREMIRQAGEIYEFDTTAIDQAIDASQGAMGGSAQAPEAGV